MDRNSNKVYIIARMIRLILLPIARLKYGKKQIWLVCEHGIDARDNGYHMFCYLRKEHPEVDAWYIISRDSADLKKIADLGNIAYLGSVNYWLLYIVAKRLLVSDNPVVPSGNRRFARYVIKKNDQKVIFLQHGIIGAMDLPIYHREQANFDMFISGAKPEFDYISKQFNYIHDEVRYTGLARFDSLYDFSTKRQILIMPTWRIYLFKPDHEKEKNDYIGSWNHLLNHPRLAEILEKNDVNIFFYPHHKMQRKGTLFTSVNNRVTICDFNNYDLQTLLKESSLLITDYSSVNFDFAYMNKPVIYYQFDEEEAYLLHHPRGYFDFQEMGFGEKVQTEEEVLDLIDEYISRDFHLKPEYEKRIKGFFTLHDRRNCERIYQEIVNTFDNEV